MEFEVIRKSHKKEIIIGISLFIILAIVLIVKFTFAKYNLVKSIKIAEGTINYKLPDFKIMAMYKNDGSGYTEIDTMPESNYAINETKSYCELNGNKDSNAKVYSDEKLHHIISNISKGSKCYLYFDKINYLMTVSYSLASATSPFLSGDITREKIESITILDKIEIPEGVTSWDVSDRQNKSIMAWYTDTNNNNLYEVYIGQDGGVKANANSQFLFSSLTNLTSITLDKLATTHVTDMSNMFIGTNTITSLDLNNFDTSNVTNMCGMFQMMTNLVNLNLRSFNTSNVTDMHLMFAHTDNIINLDLSSFDTSNVTDMSLMFYYARKLTNLDLNMFNTSKVTNMHAMFDFALSLTNLNISNFDTSNVTNMGDMFAYTKQLTTLDLSGFDTSKVLNMQSIFEGTSNLEELKLNNATFNSVTDYAAMFSSSAVSTIYVKDTYTKTFIESRLADVGKSANITVVS